MLIDRAGSNHHSSFSWLDFGISAREHVGLLITPGASSGVGRPCYAEGHGMSLPAPGAWDIGKTGFGNCPKGEGRLHDFSRGTSIGTPATHHSEDAL